ncbi:MAG: UDP-3-O-[3-hydroxymyristoyl] N-acetylglucosamine deacetylase [Deltaproteobacteria bacterium]|nr:UDP-3-O-[3-hydroxymyristoyl] N-acetylglucosamine deacetylase [Deltaproteobacteria bacterium]MBW2361076.1 UDP-3-O-[3-hydroxymyristoyl] N-acetylglucosamine deacetylase [Deltaproteobacteria bacterium]
MVGRGGLRRQRTLAEPVSCSGVGLHSGGPAALTLRPARPDTGIVFECPDGAVLPARAASVVSTRLATTLGVGAARVGTVEHVLAALWGLGVDNARIVVDGPEVPAMDGSAAAFVYLVRVAGLVEQSPAVRVMRVRKPIAVTDGARRIRVDPAPELRVTYRIDFAHPSIGRQAFECTGDDPVRFERELAGARTFGFLREVQALRGVGRARGGSMSNTLVLDDSGIVNSGGLRYPDEFVRHKVLDLFGDLSLLGARLQGHVVVERGGHSLHVALVRALLEMSHPLRAADAPARAEVPPRLSPPPAS